MAEHLTPNGRAGIIVPEGIIFQSQTAYKQLRKMLIDDYLVAVISLPAGVFNPYSGVKTSILVLDKSLAKKTNCIAFFKVNNDGYGLGAQRRPIDKNDLPQVQAEMSEYISRLRNGESGEDLQPTMGLMVNKEKVAANGEYNLSGERYRENSGPTSKYSFEPLGNICDLIGGSTPSKKIKSYWTNGTVKWISSKHIGEYGQIKGFELISQTAIVESSTRVAPKNSTIIITRVSVGKYALADDDYAINQDLTALVTKDALRLIPEFIGILAPNIASIVDHSAEGIGVRGVTRNFLSSIKIPLPPLEVQKEIVAEIEGYQKVIDGARAVIDNYRPHIAIDPEWPTSSIKDACVINPPKSELISLDLSIEVSFVPMSDIGENNMFFEPRENKFLERVKSSYTYFRENDVLIAKVTPCFENGKAGIARGLRNGIGFGSSELYVIRPRENVISEWIYIFLTSSLFRTWATTQMTGTGGLQRVPKMSIENYKIPIPPLAVQKSIISGIEAEQALVNNNRELIERMEKKIQDVLARVWGEEVKEH